MTSYIWRNTAGDENGSTKQGTRTAAGSDVITFDAENVSDGRYIHQTDLALVIAIGENEKPQGNTNELQDVGVDSVTWTITGSVSSPTTNGIFQTVKEWIFDGKTDAVYTKGRFGLELDDVTAYNLIPTGTGASNEQPRGYIISNWTWVRAGETAGKAEFVATLRFNGDEGVNTTSPKYSWTVNY